ncbi:MAG: tetratricopeptide repeat protein [Muribaculaceae bacterium]|nr:tetratricopeptide repeat protein [Muribaculaceae bacterium]
MKKFALILFGAFVALSMSAADTQSSTKTERNLVVEGNKLYAEEKYHEALECYEKALAVNPSYQYALYNKALALTQLASDDNKGTQNDPRVAARKIFEDIANLKSNNTLAAKSYYNLGNMAFNDDELDRAISMYKGSLRIENENKECRQNLLLALKKKEEQDQNQDKQDQQDQQDKNDEQQQDQQNQQDQQQEQQQQPQQQQMTQSAEQLLQAMQNKENATRRKAQQQEQPAGRRTTDKPW